MHAHDILADVIRRDMGLAPGALVPPKVFVMWLGGLELDPVAGGRAGYFEGCLIRYDDAALPAVQAYQIARAAASCYLARHALVRAVSQHDLATALCFASAQMMTRAL